MDSQFQDNMENGGDSAGSNVSADAEDSSNGEPSGGKTSGGEPQTEGTTSIERAKQATRMAAPEDASVPLDFGDEELAHHLAEASDEDLHKAAFGIIRLNSKGIIDFYNKFEQRLSGYSQEDTVGRSFFEEIAPCTDTERFSGRFFQGVRSGDLDGVFTYTFSYRMEPLIVRIRLLMDVEEEYYVLVDAMRRN